MTNSPELLEYTLGTGVRAFTTTRLGGCSEGTYASFNINEYCGDRPDHIRANRAALCHELGIGPEALILPHQVHGTTVREIDAALLRHDAATRRALLEGVDAVMTDVTGVCVGVSTADCIPVLLYDEVHRAVAAVHAGWRGTAAGIGGVTVRRMRDEFGCRPEDILAGIGPSIGACCFEVDAPVWEAFCRAPHFSPAEHGRADGGGKFHIDLKAVNARDLTQAGVLPEHITVSDLCTRCRPDVFWSHRAYGSERGSLAAFIALI